MQLDQAQKLREKWGDNPCEHPHLEKEYSKGAQTGEYVCSQCGQSFDRREKEELESKR